MGLILLSFYLYNQLNDDPRIVTIETKQGMSYQEIRKLLDQYTGSSSSYKGSGSEKTSSKASENQALRMIGGLFILFILIGIIVAIIVLVSKKQR